MLAIHGQLDLAGVALRRAGVLGARRGQRGQRVAGAVARALHVGRRRLPAAPARAAQPRRRAAALPRLLPRARPALAALAALARLGARLDALVAAPHLRPELGALPELGGRVLPDATLLPVPPPAVRPGAGAGATLRGARPAPRPAAPRRRAGRAAPARGVAREPVVVQRVRQQERVVLAAQPQQPAGEPGGVAAAAVPRAAARAAAAAGLGLGGRPLRVGPRHAHAHALHAGAAARARVARRRGGARARHEGGVPGVPQAAGAAPALARAAAVAAVAARRAAAAADARPRRDRLLIVGSLSYVFPRFPPHRYCASRSPTFLRDFSREELDSG